MIVPILYAFTIGKKTQPTHPTKNHRWYSFHKWEGHALPHVSSFLFFLVVTPFYESNDFACEKATSIASLEEELCVFSKAQELSITEHTIKPSANSHWERKWPVC